MAGGAYAQGKIPLAGGTRRWHVGFPLLNVLAIQLKRIGDLALTTPALLALKTGGARVTLAANEGTAALLPALTGFCVDKTLIYRAGGGNFGLWKRLARGGFDACVDFTGRDRSALMTLVAHAPRRIIARPALRKGGWRRLVYNDLVDSSVRARHTVDHYLDHVRTITLQGEEDFGHAALRLPLEVAARADETLAAAGIGGGEPLVVIHPGSARAEKYWVPTRWAEVIRHVGRERGLRCVLTGGSGDAFENAHLAQIRAELGADAGLCVDFAGRLDLLTGTAVLARSALCVSVDTGPMHLAAAFRRPQIALFGPTNPFHWRPRHPDAFILQSGHGNAPVRDFDPESVGGPMDAISTQAVIDCIGQIPF